MINADKQHLWEDDTARSVDQYNDWYMKFAPKAFEDAKDDCIAAIERIFEDSNCLRKITPSLVLKNPSCVSSLRALCAPPIARDRLAGLAGVSRTRVKALEEGKLPPRASDLRKLEEEELPAMLGVINALIDKRLAPWLEDGIEPTEEQRLIASSIVADRLCGAITDPIIRNAQESRQLERIEYYLVDLGYEKEENSSVDAFQMEHGTFAYHKNVPMFKNAKDDSDGMVNTPVDVVIMPKDESVKKPLLIECKSAGDFTNTNKRRKEEDTKVTQLRATYGDDVILYLFLCGYFDSTYLGYEAANHMDWVWEHRIEDFEMVVL